MLLLCSDLQRTFSWHSAPCTTMTLITPQFSQAYVQSLTVVPLLIYMRPSVILHLFSGVLLKSLQGALPPPWCLSTLILQIPWAPPLRLPPHTGVSRHKGSSTLLKCYLPTTSNCKQRVNSRASKPKTLPRWACSLHMHRNASIYKFRLQGATVSTLILLCDLQWCNYHAKEGHISHQVTGAYCQAITDSHRKHG